MKLPSGPPKANAKRTAHQQIAAIAKLVRIFATTVPAFLALEKPISRKAKPACMNITSEPARITQIVLMPTDWSSLPAIALLRSVASANAVPVWPAGPAPRAATTRGTFSHPCFLLVHRAPWPGGRGFRTGCELGGGRGSL